MTKTAWGVYNSIHTGGEICWADRGGIVVAGVAYASNERVVQYISIVDPAVPGKYKVIGVLHDGHITWQEDGEWIKPSDAPALSQPQDNSPMLSKNHKRK